MKRYYENWPGYGSPRDIVFFLHPSFDLSPIKGWNGRGPSANLLPKIGWNNNTSRERAAVKIEHRRYSKTCGRLNYNPIPWWEGYYFYLKKEKSNSPFLRIPGIFICRRNERNYKRGGNLTGPFLRLISFKSEVSRGQKSFFIFSKTSSSLPAHPLLWIDFLSRIFHVRKGGYLLLELLKLIRKQHLLFSLK